MSSAMCNSRAMARAEIVLLLRVAWCSRSSLSSRFFFLVGFAQYVTPALTSVHVPIHEMGTRAVEAVLSDAASQTTTLPTRLIVRESCGA